MLRAKIQYPLGDPNVKLAAFQRAVRLAFQETVEEACISCTALAKQNCTSLKIIDQGLLRSSIDYRTRVANGLAEGTVFVGVSYGQWVEFGRAGILKDPTRGDPRAAKAAWPPVDVIRAWVKRHTKQLAPSGRTKSGRARRPTAQALDSLTFLIGRAIYRNGIKPRPFLIPAFQRVVRTFNTRAVFHLQQRMGRVKRNP